MIQLNDTVIVQQGRLVGTWGKATHIGFDGCPEHGNCKGYVQVTFTHHEMKGKKSTYKAGQLATQEQRERILAGAAALFQQGQR